MLRLAHSCRGLILAATLARLASAQDPFAAGVRPTEPLAPAEEQASFRLPPGFEIQLVAAEPDIQKPLNMAFDARGRLWLTDTTEYPYPAPPDRRGRDSIKILEDINGDGRAERVTTLVDGLSIPIGLYPYKNGVIAYSIPNIYFFEDTDGDDRCDRRTKLYGPFDFSRDTHGMQNAFRRGFDGWLYACHGFNNQSEVRGADGHTVTMHSGNTYRMRLDGSRIEHFTWGQVNPFGMTQDALGNLFTADCHSKPVYQLLRGGYYPSFGRPHDGLGFVPPMMNHLHGSTAIAGVAIYADDRFAEEYCGNLFSGNVMTSRVNRNSLEYHGSTITAREEHDFVISEDPWFRPVDLQLAPDGSLYIADFYNRIIGHYEVPLDHPGRDRHRGRIWRVIYRGEDGSPAPRTRVDLTTAGAAELIVTLASPNLTLRTLASDQLVDRLGEQAAPAVREALATSKSPETRAHALWILARLNALDDDSLTAAATDPDRLVRIHAVKVLAEQAAWSERRQELALAAVQDTDAFVQRAAAEALGQHPDPAHIEPLLQLLERAPEEDLLLRHAARIGLRNGLRHAETLTRLADLNLKASQTRDIADVLLAVPSAGSAAFLLDFLPRKPLDRERLRTYVEHVARHIEPRRIGDAAAIVRRNFSNDLDLQYATLRSLQDGVAQRGAVPPESLRPWAENLAAQLLESTKGQSLEWVNSPLSGATVQDNPWVLQQRASADGDTQSLFLSSLLRGEQLTGVLRSPEFVAPAKLSFYAAGHIGPPNQPVVARNFIRLREVGTDTVLEEATPPRNDTAQRIEWDLSAYAGRRCYLEIVDGDQRRAYAWLAVGRFQPVVATMPMMATNQVSERRQAAARLVVEWRLRQFLPQLEMLLGDPRLENATQKAIADAILTLRGDPLLAAATVIISDPATSDHLRSLMIGAIAHPDEGTRNEAVTAVFQQSPERLQTAIALNLASFSEGAEALLSLAERGIASSRLLSLAAVSTRLTAHKQDRIQDRLDRLTQSLPPANESLRLVIELRRAGHGKAAISVERGAQVFEKHCAACHQIGGKGALIGPQLDGVGTRGLERLLEDVLAPNQNVDVAFRTTTFALADGRVLSGMIRREEGEVLIIANDKGEEIKISKSDIDEQSQTPHSLMPENVVEIVPEDDFHHLIGFLLNQRGQPRDP